MRRLLVLGPAGCSLRDCASRNLRKRGGKGVKVIADEAHRRVDITIDGQPFTSYIWPTIAEEAGPLSR